MKRKNTDDLIEKIKSVLDMWPSYVEGKGAQISFEDFFKILDAATDSPLDLKDDLEKLGLVSVMHTGAWTLTDVANKIKYKGHHHLKTEKSVVPTNLEPYWKDFRALLEYYIAYAGNEDKVQFYLNPEKEGREFCVSEPFEYGWLQDKNEDRKTHIIKFKDSDLPVLNAISEFSDSSTSVCVGYPLLTAFNKEGEAEYHIPLAVIPVKPIRRMSKPVKACRYFTIEIEMDFDNAKINEEWIDRTIPEEDRRELYKNIIEDPENGYISIALRYILSYAGIKEDSNELEQYLPKIAPDRKRRIITNTAVLFKASPTLYNKSLLTELKQIKNMPADILEKTSLAYVFRNPRKKYDEQLIDVIPFDNLNGEQYKAVSNALNCGVSVIQGPPGTGKSQVAVNIIKNNIYYGQSVLFTSRNHAALDAIKGRSVIKYGNLYIPITFFCVDSDIRANWDELDYREQRKQLQELTFEDDYLDLFGKKFKQYIEVKKQIDELEKLKADIEDNLFDYNSKFESVMESLFGRNYENTQIKKINLKKLKIYSATLIKKSKWEKLLFFLVHPSWKCSMKFVRDNYVALDRDVSHSDIEKIISDYEKIKDRIQNGGKSETFPDSEYRNLIKTHDDCFNELIKFYPQFLLQQWSSHAEDITDKDIDELKINVRKYWDLGLSGKSSDSISDYYALSCSLKKMHAIYPSFSAPMQSLYRAAPLIPGVFDQLIIDEAAQCNAYLAIPAMFRAKHATIIGDPEQFKPIRSVTESKRKRLWASIFKNDYTLLNFDTHDHTLYDVIRSGVKDDSFTLLREHYRSNPEIMDYISNAFYDGQLFCRTDLSTLEKSDFQSGKGIIWIDVSDNENQEITTAINCYSTIRKSGFLGSIGVISPLSRIASYIQNYAKNMNIEDENLKINTVYSFQGGEMDIIIFVIGLTHELSRGAIWYLTNPHNKDIYNVAISRAKSQLIVIGDKEKCKDSGLIALRKLADISIDSSGKRDNSMFESPWEERFYDALEKDGSIDMEKVFCQFEFRGYRFDFAYIDREKGVFLDIEIDGVRYHTHRDSSRLESDIRRDNVSMRNGWSVLRFWVTRLRIDMDSCIDDVKEKIKELSK